jgi:hypothetical protein
MELYVVLPTFSNSMTVTVAQVYETRRPWRPKLDRLPGRVSDTTMAPCVPQIGTCCALAG